MSEKPASPPNVPRQQDEPAPAAAPESPPSRPEGHALPPEIGGPTGPEPTRYGDWERKGRVSDF
jgi:hypothetical protein